MPMTLNFWRMCLANALLYVSAYMLLPLLPFAVGGQTGVSVGEAACLLPMFVAGMFVTGPFHAYLGDACRRKHVLIGSMLLMVAATVGYTSPSLQGWGWVRLLALLQGAAFGIAVTAGITVSIDITPSERRSAGNMLHAWAARMGMLIGAVAGVWLCRSYGFRETVYASAVAGMAGCLCASRVHVVFRAPIGVRVPTLDRFLLPRAWVPALNVLPVAFAAGVLLPTLWAGSLWPLAALALLSLSAVPLTRMFVNLSHHCQRGTANTTLHLAVETGTLLGVYAACRLMGEADIRKTAAVALLMALLLFVLPTRAYYKKKRVR